MKLITFGCSWTKGVGIPYEKGMSKEEYLKVRSSSIKNLDDSNSDISSKLDIVNQLGRAYYE